MKVQAFTVFLTVIHVMVSILLVISILLQSSKGGGLAGAFGGGGGMTGVFGGRGAATFLGKVTMWLAIIFAATTFSIALISKNATGGARSMIQQVAEQEQQATPSAMLPTVPEAAAPGNEGGQGAELPQPVE